MNARGFSLVEIVVSMAGFAVVFGLIATAMVQDTQTHRALVSQSVPQMRLNDAMTRITNDLRMAGIWGEDRNRDGVFDAEEDLNGNGQFDSDWSFPKVMGAAIEPQDSIAFNIRRDEIDPATGTVTGMGIYTERVAYRLIGDDLVRETTEYDALGAPEVTRAVIASGVGELRFLYEPGASGTMMSEDDAAALPVGTYDGGLVRIRISCDIPQPGGGFQRRTLRGSVWLRN